MLLAPLAQPSHTRRISGHAGENVLERAQNADRVQVIVVADVRDAKELAFHFALAISHHGVEGLAEFFDDRSGVNPFGRAIAVSAAAGDVA